MRRLALICLKANFDAVYRAFCLAKISSITSDSLIYLPFANLFEIQIEVEEKANGQGLIANNSSVAVYYIAYIHQVGLLCNTKLDIKDCL